MSEHPKIVLTFKASGGYDAPWIVIHGDTVDEASHLLQELRDRGAFSAVKEAAREFAGTVTTEQAVTTVQQAFPGSQVIPPPAAPPGPPVSYPPAQQPQYPPTPPVQQGTPPCTTCGAPTTFKQGVSSRGPWSAYMCSSRIREHATFL